MTYTPEKATGISGSGKVTVPAYCMIALTLIGISVALYVARGNYTGQPLWCPIIDGCNVVVNSPYSRVFGVPMSYFGFIYYLYMFALAARLAYDSFSNSLRFRAVLTPRWARLLRRRNRAALSRKQGAFCFGGSVMEIVETAMRDLATGAMNESHDGTRRTTKGGVG